MSIDHNDDRRSSSPPPPLPHPYSPSPFATVAAHYKPLKPLPYKHPRRKPKAGKPVQHSTEASIAGSRRHARNAPFPRRRRCPSPPDPRYSHDPKEQTVHRSRHSIERTNFTVQQTVSRVLLGGDCASPVLLSLVLTASSSVRLMSHRSPPPLLLLCRQRPFAQTSPRSERREQRARRRRRGIEKRVHGVQSAHSVVVVEEQLRPRSLVAGLAPPKSRPTPDCPMIN